MTGPTSDLAGWAVAAAGELLASEEPVRWQHVSAAIDKARAFAPAVPGEEDLL